MTHLMAHCAHVLHSVPERLTDLFIFTFQPTSHWTLYVLLIGHYSLPPPLSFSLIIALTPDPIRSKKGRVYAECCY